MGTYTFHKPSSVFAKDGQTENFSVNARAKVFCVPTALGPAEEYYSVYDINHFVDYSSYYIQAYNLGDNNSTSLIVEYGSEKKPSISSDTSPFMFDHMTYISDENGNTTYKLYGSSQGSEITKICDADDVSFTTTGVGFDTYPLSKGDIIRTTENSRGETVTVDRLLSARAALAGQVPYGTVKEEGGDSGYRKQFLTLYGKLYNRDGGLVTLCFEEPVKDPDATRPPLTNVSYSKELKVTCYDSAKDRVDTVSLGELESYNITNGFYCG